MAKFLEPIAVKKASLITGVAQGYFEPVLERNPHLREQAVYGAMPYGGEQKDHDLLAHLDLKPYLFEKKPGKIQLVYAGAMLPKAYQPLEAIFKSIAVNQEIFKKVEFHFIGTGKTPNDAEGYNIKPLAEKYGLWQTTIYEYPKRIPYLDVLVHLQNADGIFILGSTEPHYTPSKSYQGVLSRKPILAVLHKESTAVEVLEKSGAGMVMSFDGKEGIISIENKFSFFTFRYLQWLKEFKSTEINKELFDQYSAREITKQLAALLNLSTLKMEI
jgi:hypothetical protein